MTDHEPTSLRSATWANPLVLEAEAAHEREADLRGRSQTLIACAENALADLAQSMTWLNKDSDDDLCAYRAIQRACERLRKGIGVATGQDA